MAIVPPTTGDDYESDGSSGESDDECRPMTAQELKMKSVSFYFIFSRIYWWEVAAEGNETH